MGSYIAWKLDADTNYDKIIIDTANSMSDFLEDSPKFEDFIWRRFTPETKWYAVAFVKQLSEKFDIIFRLEARGDENFVLFFLQGKILSENEIWDRPKFPSRPLFKKKHAEVALKRKEENEMRQQKQAEQEKLRLQKEIALLKAKQEELEKKLVA